MQISQTVVINCAGRGARLGFGHTKALLEIAGKPIIIHHLEQLQDVTDVRVVVGFNAKDVIKTVISFRKDITFVFNHDYATTNTLASLYLGTKFANDLILTVDGDLLIDPEDFQSFLGLPGELIGYIETYSDDPVCIDLENKNDQEYVTAFTREKKEFEWTGLAKLKREHIIKDSGHVYQSIEKFLPMKAKKINCREIDTPKDLEKALEWSKNIF